MSISKQQSDLAIARAANLNAWGGHSTQDEAICMYNHSRLVAHGRSRALALDRSGSMGSSLSLIDCSMDLERDLWVYKLAKSSTGQLRPIDALFISLHGIELTILITLSFWLGRILGALGL